MYGIIGFVYCLSCITEIQMIESLFLVVLFGGLCGNMYLCGRISIILNLIIKTNGRNRHCQNSFGAYE